MALEDNDLPAHALRPAECFQMVREVTGDLLRAQHANRLLALENQELRQQLRDDGRGGRERWVSVVLSDSEALLACDLHPARSHDIRSSRGTQTELERPADDHAAVHRIGLECERELDALRAAVVHQLTRLAYLDADFVSLAHCNAQQHQHICELRRVCTEHSALLDALQLVPCSCRASNSASNGACRD
jgi:hypothetical protein